MVEGTFFDDSFETYFEKLREVIIERWQIDQSVYDFIREAEKREAS